MGSYDMDESPLIDSNLDGWMKLAEQYKRERDAALAELARLKAPPEPVAGCRECGSDVVSMGVCYACAHRPGKACTSCGEPTETALAVCCDACWARLTRPGRDGTG